MQRLRATEKSDFPIFFLLGPDHFTKNKIGTFLLNLLSTVTTFNSISDIWNIMKQREVSPVAQLLDLTEDCWSQAGLGEADILWPLIGQY